MLSQGVWEELSIPMSGVVSAGSQVLLGWPEPREFDRITALRNRSFVRKWFLDDGLLDAERNRGFLAKNASDLTSAVLAVRCAKTGAFLGTIGWSQWDRHHRTAEFGRLAIDVAGVRGLGKPRPRVAHEATRLLARLAFERLGMTCLYADVMRSNEKSLAVCRRLGMRVAAYPVKTRPNGERIEMVRFELTQGDRSPRHVERRIAGEETGRDHLEAYVGDRHHRPLLGPRDVRDAQRVPDHHVLADE